MLEQHLRIALDRAEIATRVLPALPRGQEPPGRSEDERERRAQLVAHVGQEHRFRPARRLRVVLRSRQVVDQPEILEAQLERADEESANLRRQHDRRRPEGQQQETRRDARERPSGEQRADHGEKRRGQVGDEGRPNGCERGHPANPRPPQDEQEEQLVGHRHPRVEEDRGCAPADAGKPVCDGQGPPP